MNHQKHHGKGYKEVQNGPRNSIPKDFIPSGINPNNNAFFDCEANPMSSKGNSVIAEEYNLFDPNSKKT